VVAAIFILIPTIPVTRFTLIRRDRASGLARAGQLRPERSRGQPIAVPITVLGGPEPAPAAYRYRVPVIQLLPHMTVERNVTLAPVKVLGLSRAEAAARAAELLGRFGLGEKRADYPDRLSGGQQQRVAIVRALAMRPRLLLLDEVTSALDPELVADVLDVIRELAEGGMTMLIATHEMWFARDIASRVCFLADGQIVEQAPPARLFSEPSDERTRRFLRRITDAGRL